MTHLRPGRVALRFLAVSGVALATANCASTPPGKLAAGSGSSVDPKYGVKASPRLYNEGDVIPKGGGRRFSGKPYVVAGKTYEPRENAKGYVREGLASWYGSAFHGRMTANGEVFDRHSIAAAHPTLPLPSYARVTNLENGASMIVRVNDRGPYHAGRVMDVSEDAAEALGFHRRGTARVRVEYAGKASLAGSDDRKLLATLRTDGRPAGMSSPVMVADLGPSEETESFSRGATPLAYKPAPEKPEPAEEAPRRIVRAPIVLASAAVTVPAAVQPTANRTREFKPAPVQAKAMPVQANTTPVHFAAATVSGGNPGKMPMAVHASAKDAAKASPAGKPSLMAAKAMPAGKPAPVVARLAAAAPEPHKAMGRHAPAVPENSKLAMAKLTAQAAPAAKPGKGKEAPKDAKAAHKDAARQVAKAPESPARSGGHGARYAGIY